MKFTVSTKPLVDGLNLGILDANITNYYQKSTMAQVHADKSGLKINLESSLIYTELRFKGLCEGEPLVKRNESGEVIETVDTIFVDSRKLKQLVSTFESATTIFEFDDTGLILYSGKSKFTLPKTIDAAMTFKSPSTNSADAVEIDKDDWKFIKDYQLYALAMSFIHPVYTKVFVNSNNDVIVGDFDNSLFTHSKKCKLGDTCLLSDTIINLFNAVPEGTKLFKLDESYVLNVSTDGFEMFSEFTPKHETDSDMGNYMSETILNMMSPEGESVSVNVNSIQKVLKQAEVLDNNKEAKITFKVANDKITLSDNNTSCEIDIEGKISTPYELQFKTSMLKSVMSNCSDDTVTITPSINHNDDGTSDVIGINVSSKDLTTVLGGLE